MDVTREDVLRCAKLARLSLREEEIEPLRLAMAQILGRAEKLAALPLDGVPPMLQDLPLPRREDEVEPSFTQEQALANAPAQSRGHFAVPKVL